MENALSSPRPILVTRWRELVMPKEHGSWSLAFEPLAFGLLAAPSGGGVGLAVAAAAAFFARRPLRIAIMDARLTRRVAARSVLGWLAAVALVAFSGAIAVAGTGWLGWLLPAAAAGVAFAAFDLRNAGREEAAEVAGAATFALLPAAFAAMAGAGLLAASALGVAMLARSVPTVLTVRAAIRAAKGGRSRSAFAVGSAILALGALMALARADLVPVAAVAAAVLFTVRTLALLVYPRPAFRARTLGMIEGALGGLFVVVVGCAWTW